MLSGRGPCILAVVCDNVLQTRVHTGKHSKHLHYTHQCVYHRGWINNSRNCYQVYSRKLTRIAQKVIRYEGFFLLLRYLRDYWKYFQILITDFLGQWFFFSWFVLQVSRNNPWLSDYKEMNNIIKRYQLKSYSLLHV